MMEQIKATGITVFHGQNRAVNAADFTLDRGELVGLVGPNGAGKTSLLRAVLGLLPASGQCNLLSLDSRRRARLAAFLPQQRAVAWALPVEQLIRLGRLPYQERLFGFATAEADPAAAEQAIQEAIRRMEISHLRHKPVTELSGGEVTRVMIARLLAQQAPFLMLDEPIAGLDPALQLRVMESLAALARPDTGKSACGVLLTIHDLGLAARYCDRLIILHQGRFVAEGRPLEVLTETVLAEVFGVRAWYQQTADGLIFQVTGRQNPATGKASA